ncbi:hypothetical protein EON83_02725 [bacterium]|nr:MAG: hypothetical protein EON83_02725 [bacterium]
MIKTTPFALPRPAQASPQSKSRARQHAIKASRSRAATQSQTQPSLSALFPAPLPVPEISAAQAREIMAQGSSKPKSKAKPVSAAPIVSQPVSAPKIETIMPSTSPAPKKTPRTAKSKAPAPTIAPEPIIVATPIESAPVEAVAAIVEKTAPKKAAAGVKKARRPRVPVNLAEQYGQNLSKRVENGVEIPSEEDTPKKRLNRAERQARRELMTPDDDLMARLHRVHNAIPSAKPIKRPKGWRFDCGRCGQTSFFQTSGAICTCGALAIKEAN